MECQKITNILGTILDEEPIFITKKWVKVYDQSGSADDKHKPSKQITFKTSMLRSNWYGFGDACIAVKEEVTVTGGSNNIKRNRPLTFKNNAPFIGCISKINNALIDNAEDLDAAMPMYNLIEYRKTTGILWNYCRDELSDDKNNKNNLNKNVINSGSFKYKTSITGSTYNVDAKITNSESNQVNNPDYDAEKSGKKEVKIIVPLKYLSNFWRALKMLLINCEVSLGLPWCKDCVITSMERTVITNRRRDTSLANVKFQIKDTKLYVPVVTWSTKDDNISLEQLKSGFKRTSKWNKYRSKMTNQTKSNHLNHLIDPT